MALQMKKEFPAQGKTYPVSSIDCNLLIHILRVSRKYSNDPIGLFVPLSEVFQDSSYCGDVRSFFNHALLALQNEGFITRTAFSVALTSAGYDYIHGIQ